MKVRGFCAAIGVVSALALLSAPFASAAIEVGNECTGGAADLNRTFFSLGNPIGTASPPSFPTDGVVTAWRTRVSDPAGSAAKMVIGRAEGNHYRIVEETGFQALVAGLNTFPARIPVKAGDLPGLSGRTSAGLHATPACAGAGAGARAWVIEDPGGLGKEFEFTNFQVPAVAVLEPDVDHDGYGDETQDGCPQNAGTHGACGGPGGGTLSLSVKGQARRRAAVVQVTVNVAAQIAVTGKVSLRKGRKPLTLRANPQSLAGGGAASFVLRFPAKLRAKLASLANKRSLQLRISVSASSATTGPASSSFAIRLRGTARG